MTKDEKAQYMLRWREANKAKTREHRATYLSNPESIEKKREADKRRYASLTEGERKARVEKNRAADRRYKAAHLKPKRAKLSQEEIKARKKLADAKCHAAKREERSAKAHERYLKNKEIILAKAKAWHAANPGAAQEKAARWNRQNPERRSIISKVASHKRRARIEGAGGVVTEDQLRDLFKRQRGKCSGCKKRLGKFEDGKWHHDHVMPIALGGANTIENAQILCQSCNCRKQAKHPERWAAELGRLFA